jgi:hypothetical protein
MNLVPPRRDFTLDQITGSTAIFYLVNEDSICARADRTPHVCECVNRARLFHEHVLRGDG